MQSYYIFFKLEQLTKEATKITRILIYVKLSKYMKTKVIKKYTVLNIRHTQI